MYTEKRKVHKLSHQPCYSGNALYCCVEGDLKLEKKNTKVLFIRELAFTMTLVMFQWVLIIVSILLGDFYNGSLSLDTDIPHRNYKCYSLMLIMINQNLTFIQLSCQWKLLFDSQNSFITHGCTCGGCIGRQYLS